MEEVKVWWPVEMDVSALWLILCKLNEPGVRAVIQTEKKHDSYETFIGIVCGALLPKPEEWMMMGFLANNLSRLLEQELNDSYRTPWLERRTRDICTMASRLFNVF